MPFRVLFFMRVRNYFGGLTRDPNSGNYPCTCAHAPQVKLRYAFCPQSYPGAGKPKHTFVHKWVLGCETTTSLSMMSDLPMADPVDGSRSSENRDFASVIRPSVYVIVRVCSLHSNLRAAFIFEVFTSF